MGEKRNASTRHRRSIYAAVGLQASPGSQAWLGGSHAGTRRLTQAPWPRAHPTDTGRFGGTRRT